MNMMKKIAMGAGALALTFGLVACGDDSGSEGTSEITGVTLSSDSTSWKISGLIEADYDIAGIAFTVTDSAGKNHTGLVSGFDLAKLKTPGTPLATLNLDSTGLDAEIFASDLDSAKACGKLTLSMAVTFMGDDSTTAVAEAVTYSFTHVCSTSNPGDPDVPDVTAGFDSVEVTLGGLSSTTVGSSVDLDASANTVYKQSEVTAAIANEIDLIFSGDKIMTPLGTEEAKYMATVYANSNSLAMFWTVTDAQLAAVKSVGDFTALMDTDKGEYSAAITSSSKFLVMTSKGAPMLVIVKTIDGVKTVTLVKVSEKAK